MHPRVNVMRRLWVALTLLMLQPAVVQPIPVAALDYSSLNQIQKRILSGTAQFELDPNGEGKGNQQPDSYFPTGSSNSCPVNLGSNIKVNQNCLNLTDTDLQGRGQAEHSVSIATDPMNTNHVLVSYNDFRRGDSECYASWSVDGTRTFNDTTIPMSFTRGQPAFGAPREYWTTGGQTSVAFDTRGNSFLACQTFNRGIIISQNPDRSSAIYVYRSSANFGASWNFPGRPVTESNDVAGTGTAPFEDKPYLTVDNIVGSPFQDRIFVTWTEFASTGSAYIWEAYSSDAGEHFSTRHLVSATTPLCVNTFGAGVEQGNCNENQFSQPFTGKDGALYVVFSNFNNATKGGLDNRTQVLLAKSTDGGNTFSVPVKVADYYDPPDCATYQGGRDPGRACVPEKGSTTNSVFRAVNYPSGAVNPTNASQVVVTFGSYINVHSNESNGCSPNGISPSGNNLYIGVKTPGACNNDILVSVSNDGGATFTGTTTDPRALTTATPQSGQATTDQFWQWEAFTSTAKFAVSYYDRQYGTDETTGSSDISLSGSTDLATFHVALVTSSSMPPPTEFGGVLYGDYSGLTASGNANPAWMDTRSPMLFLCPGSTTGALCGASETGLNTNDQDVYTENIGVPTK